MKFLRLVGVSALVAALAADGVRAQLTLAPSDYDQPMPMDRMTAPGTPPPREISQDPAALAAFQRGLADVCAMAASLPAGPERTQAEDACAYLRLTLDLGRVAVGRLVGTAKAATYPDWVTIDPQGRRIAGGYAPRRIGSGGRMFPLPNWLVIDERVLGPAGPFRAGASCLERFYGYSVLVHEVYRATGQELEQGNACQGFRTEAVGRKRQLDRIDEALARGGMPSAGSSAAACTFTPRQRELLADYRARQEERRRQWCCDSILLNCPPIPECAGIQ